MSLSGEMGGRKSARVFGAVDAYLKIAADHGIDPVHMAMAWQKTRPFSVCPIFGATTTDQLTRILSGRGMTLAPDVITALNTAHKAHPMPY